MAKLFHVKITTPEKMLFESKASSVTAPGEIGYLGILADHAPLITTLVPGKVSIRDGTGKRTVISSPGGGFLEVLKNNVTLLLDSAESLPK